VAIERAITRKHSPVRRPVTASARLLLTQRALTPDRLWDAFMRTQFPRPKA
jgi:hypothetical protein